MSLIYKTEQQGKIQVVEINGRFDFRLHADFRQAITQLDAQQPLVIDLCATEYMDSSALGLLLLLRQRNSGQSIQLRYLRASAIEEILSASNFSRLFELVEAS